MAVPCPVSEVSGIEVPPFLRTLEESVDVHGALLHTTVRTTSAPTALTLVTIRGKRAGNVLNNRSPFPLSGLVLLKPVYTTVTSLTGNVVPRRLTPVAAWDALLRSTTPT